MISCQLFIQNNCRSLHFNRLIHYKALSIQSLYDSSESQSMTMSSADIKMLRYLLSILFLMPSHFLNLLWTTANNSRNIVSPCLTPFLTGIFSLSLRSLMVAALSLYIFQYFYGRFICAGPLERLHDCWTFNRIESFYINYESSTWVYCIRLVFFWQIGWWRQCGQLLSIHYWVSLACTHGCLICCCLHSVYYCPSNRL